MSRNHQSVDRWKLHDATTRRIAIGRANGERCYRCDGAIDYSLPGTHRLGPTGDHVPSLADVLLSGGDPYALEGLAVSHRRCNASAGSKARPVRSRQWLRSA